MCHCYRQLPTSWDEFLVQAHEYPDRIESILEEVREREWEDANEQADNLVAEDHNRHETIPFHTDAFQVDLSNLEPLLPLEEKYTTPGRIPSILVSGDIDSVYTFADSLEKIVDACGTKNRWMMQSKTKQGSTDTGSRFCVNSELIQSPPFIRRGEAKTVPLNWFPNVKIAVVHIAEFGYDMHVHMYYLGIEKFSQKAHFSKLQMGVVNAMFNGARAAITSSPENYPASVVHEMRRFENLETPATIGSYASIERNHMSPAAMKVLSRLSVVILDAMAENNASMDFHHSYFNGILPNRNNLEKSREDTLDRTAMVEFAKKLRNGLLFTASIAGCKGRFADKQYERLITLDAEWYENEMREDATILQEVLERVNDTLEDGQLEFNGTDNLPPMQNFPTIYAELMKDLNDSITQARNDIARELGLAFHSAFVTQDEQGVEIEDDHSYWYCDLGIEIGFPNQDVNIFPVIKDSKEILKKQLRQR